MNPKTQEVYYTNPQNKAYTLDFLLSYLPSAVCLIPASRVNDGHMVKKWTMF